MTFKQAHKKLKKIAGGEYHTIGYELTVNCQGEETPKCTIYIHNTNHHIGRTWQESFDSMDIAMNGPDPIDKKEQP